MKTALQMMKGNLIVVVVALTTYALILLSTSVKAIKKKETIVIQLMNA